MRPELTPLQIAFTDNPLVGGSFLTARLTALKVIGKYIWLLFFPVHLSADYSYNQIPLFTGNLRTWGDWQVAFTALVIGAVGLLAVYSWRRDRRWLFFIGLGALGLAPVSNIAKLIGTIMAERFLYIPAVAFAGCMVLTGLLVVHRFPSAERRVIPVIALLITLTFCIRTWARNSDWATSRTMWASMAKTVPNSYKAHAFFFGSTIDEALNDCEAALAIVRPLPDRMSTPVPYINAGVAYRKKGEAVAQTSPADAARWYHRSLDTLFEGQRIARAVGFRHSDLDEQLGVTYTRLRDYSLAIRALRDAQRLDTKEEMTRELSDAYVQSGDTHNGEIALWEGILADPGNQHISGWLLDLYQRSEAGSCALQPQPGGWAMNPSCPLVHDELCSASAAVFRNFQGRGLAPQAAELRNAGISQFGCSAELY
ncbi:MAG TPA: DUF1736 domain-containing protein [Bryobacteraceae bacterium]|nr:DUF1736 domain-containing protein [Bryobacteraceae bacterium]